MSKPNDKSDRTGRAGFSRRGFLKGAATAFAAAGVFAGTKTARADDEIPVKPADAEHFTAGPIPARTLATGRAIGANDRIRIAVIGCGGQGFGAHVKGLIKFAKENNIEAGGCSDLWNLRLERAKKEMSTVEGVQVVAEKDYRKILDNKDIDAVVVATPEHWHAPVSIHAMQAGKHVYSEKPMTRYLDEAFQVMDTQKATGRVFQCGIQYTSSPKFKAIADYIKSGKIGPLVTGQGSYCRNSGKTGEWNYAVDKTCDPTNLDWKMWLGNCPQREWNDDSRERFFRYRKYFDYSGGILGDLMPHKLGPFLLASGNPEFPTRVSCLGTRKISLDREVDDSVQVMAEFPSGWMMLFTGSTVNEQGLVDSFRGHKATIVFGGEGAKAMPERPFAEEVDAAEITKGGLAGVPDHHKNWIQAIRTGSPVNCPVDLGAKVQAIVSMAEMSSRLHKTILFDEATRTVKPS